jgi:hypothetical protein
MNGTLLQRHPALGRHLRVSSGDDGIDFVSADGRWGIDVAGGLRSVRDLGALVLRLARWLAAHASKRAALVVGSPRLTPQMEGEWAAMVKVLRPDVAHRLSLFGADPPRPGTPAWVAPLLEALRPAAGVDRGVEAEARAAPTGKLFDVVKVLLHRWLRGEGPIRVLALAEQAGCSYPTVFKAIGRLDRYGELTRTSRRSVLLKDFPARTWSELTALLPSLRETATFVDATRRPFSADGFLARIRRHRPDRVALGGVEAARRWHPGFNLNGTPRIDLVVHAPERYDLSFVSEIDPALMRCPTGDVRQAHAVVLAVHRLARRLPLFEPDPKKGVPFADPVEVLLDLHELRLVEQAEELIRHLTERRRRGA